MTPPSAPGDALRARGAASAEPLPTHPHPPPLADYVCRRLEGWAAQLAPAGLAGFFQPCDYLRAAAAGGRKLSAGRAAAARL